MLSAWKIQLTIVLTCTLSYKAVVLKVGGGGRAMWQREKKKNVGDLWLFSESSLCGEIQRVGLTQTNQIHSFISDPQIKTELSFERELRLRV